MSMFQLDYDKFIKKIKGTETMKFIGKVKKVVGLTIEVEGINAFIGELCNIKLLNGKYVQAEVVGFTDKGILLMPLGDLTGVSTGSLVFPTGSQLQVPVGKQLLGKILDGLGRPLDGSSIMYEAKYNLDSDPPNPLQRKRITDIIPTGVKAIDGFLTCGLGQRVGIFAGSGVGKSTLLGMIAKYSEADVNVIGLIGERGREVKEFIEKDLGEEGLKKSVIVVATSDQPPLLRLKGAFTATAIAEYFRDQGLNVMLMMDSVTRFAMAQREVGLTIGEPPTTKGYTPSVFAMLPRLLERSGNSNKGSITAFYTVLVDGDDFNEPIADAVRGILDGHIVLSRKLASMNHFPAIDILSSISRLMPQIAQENHYQKASELRDLLAIYKESEDLINVGAYQKGSNYKIDRAIALNDKINGFLRQKMNEHHRFAEVLEMLNSIN
ncbi:flagellar protein export ATPase FliI [Caloramator proteoclasticus]|uniref:Type 3 secretion system ATPase n=1 Tax=Caloramator proteoclasticus DSM 10124 TaxID=1121262 RepID=A0A1M4SU00_9CLOT|nr:flagellar protein export ATPase FliI [Caloramator proteoclasticus]SHE35639.1 type III secretion system ATPase, FliI/YscN [Caloramator proteoclasticus DSM 10124]